MTETTTVRAARRTVKPGGRKTANRFAKLAGGETIGDTAHSPADGSDPAQDSGLIGAMSAVAADEAHRVVQIQVAEIASHPFNDQRRSQPQPGDPKWDELLNGVRANGVRLPVLVVPREAFVAARPSAAGQILADARYVLVYGHRRRAAALEAGRDTVPAVIDDAIMADDGDLDAMATENLGRQDLSELAAAELFARYSEIGQSQRAIADRLGIDQATVSRRLALLLLAPELRRAVDDGELPSAEAAALAGALPYGPARRWQKKNDPGQGSEQRRAEQVQAQWLVLKQRWSATRAAERVIAERNARAEAARLGIPLVDDPRAELGENYLQRRVAASSPGDDAIGAINPGSGVLDLYIRSVPDNNTGDQLPTAGTDDTTATAAPAGGCAAAAQPHAGSQSPAEDRCEDPDPLDDESVVIAEKQRAATAAAAAQANRRQFCALLITHQPSKADLLKILVGQYLSGVAARSATSAVAALLRDWDAHVDGAGEKARNASAWHRVVAAAELHTTELKDKAWDDDAVTHIKMLIERVGYQPTPWEHDQLAVARA